MLNKTRGIVFHQIKYSETSVIVKIYTETLGLQSYLVRGIRQKKSKIKSGLFQPLTLLDLIVYHKEKRDLHHIKEIKIDYQFQTIHSDIKKSSIILFLNELLLKSIKEEEANQSLFEFIYQSLLVLDLSEKNISNFHLYFALQLTKFLGFYPKANYTGNNEVFNLLEGSYQGTSYGLKYFINPELSYLWNKIQHSHFDDDVPNKITSNQRQLLLQKMFEYYSIHLPAFKELKSIHVLSEVLK